MYELHLNYLALLRVYSTFEIPHRISLQIYKFFTFTANLTLPPVHTDVTGTK